MRLRIKVVLFGAALVGLTLQFASMPLNDPLSPAQERQLALRRSESRLVLRSAAALKDAHSRGSGKTATPTVAPTYVAEPTRHGGSAHGGIDALTTVLGGCHMLEDEAACVRSRDGRSGLAYIGGEPCAWCCGLPCLKTSRNKCEPKAYLERNPKFAGRFRSNDSSTCHREASAPPTPPPLAAVAGGCHTLHSEAACVGSRDGRSEPEFGGQSAGLPPPPSCPRDPSRGTPRAAAKEVLAPSGEAPAVLCPDAWQHPEAFARPGKGGTGKKKRSALGPPCVWCCGLSCFQDHRHACMSVHMSTHMSMGMPVHTPVHMSVYMPVQMRIHMSVPMSARISVPMSVPMSVPVSA